MLVPQAALAENKLPQVQKIIFESDFTSGKLPYEISSENNDGEVYISGGRLFIGREDGNSPVVYFHNKNRSSVRGKISVEADIEKTEGSGIWIRCAQIYFYWRSDNVLLSLSGGGVQTVAGKYSDKIRLQLVLDTQNQKASYWVNGAKKLDGGSFRSAADSFENMYFYISDGSGSIMIDSYRSYYVKKEYSPVQTEDIIISEDDFNSSASLPDFVSVSDYATGDVYISGGKLCLDRGETGSVGPTVYLNAPSAAKGLISFETDIEKPTDVGMWVRSSAFYFYWRSDNNIIVQTCSDKPGGNVVNTACGKYSGSVRLKVTLDTSSGFVSLWVGGALKVEKSYARLADITEYKSSYAYVSEGTGKILLDNYRLYYQYPDLPDRVYYDRDALTYDCLLTEPFLQGNITASEFLNLQSCGYYGSEITWKSDNEAVIDSCGNIYRDDLKENCTVTLTATISGGNYSLEKQFVFTVLRGEESASDIEADMQDLSIDMLLGEYNADENNIVCSLRLMPEGVRGSKITWKSSAPDVITASGRVIRPKMSDGDRKVTLTAVFDSEHSKSFDFTVLQDNYHDMQYHADEDFFGVWNGREWEKSPRINYSYNGNAALSLAESAAKSGDYELAKKYVLNYWRTREKKVTSAERMPLAAKIAEGHIYHEGEVKNTDLGVGKITAHEYRKTEIPLTNIDIFKKSASVGMALLSLYDESSTAKICSGNAQNAEMRPKLELVVNGQVRSYEVSDDVTLRGGKYADTCYGADEELTVKSVGDFLGENSYKSFLRFNYDYINDTTDKITSANLVVYAKLEESFVDEKEVALLLEKSNFTEKSTLSSLTGFIYSWDGLPGKNTWEAPKYASSEYLSQSCRFLYNECMRAEYTYSKNEDYAYFLISEAMDFLADQVMERTYSGNTCSGTSRALYGNYLACSARAGFYTLISSDIIDSKYMTPEVFGTLLKAVWDYEDVINRTELGYDMVNWGIIFYRQLMYTASVMPELYISESVFSGAKEKLEGYLLNTTFEDGSYKEAATSYTVSSLATFRQIKQVLEQNGFETSSEYDERLKKTALYNLLLSGARYTRWGDSGLSDSGGYFPMLYQPFYNWFGDREILYIGTFGQSGDKPAFTSRLYKDNMTAFLHSDWTKDQTFIFTNVRGPSNHAHQDDNHIFLSSHDRTLLGDSGVGTYDSADVIRKWLISTRAHNTVEINDQSQTGSGKEGDFGLQGELHDWVSSDNYDFLSQSSASYRDNCHRRSITFLKPDIIIVSDRMTPDDKEKTNTYRQLWHTMPDSALSIDAENNLARTNYGSGADLYISCADDVSAERKSGYYDYSSGQVGENPYLSFEMSKSGAVDINTVLFPHVGDGSVKAEKIGGGDNAVRLKITAQREEEKQTIYYILNYDNENHAEAEFGGYLTNAETAVVTLNESGQITSAYLSDGSYIKDKNKKYIIDCAKISDFAERNCFDEEFTLDKDTLYCTCPEEYAAEQTDSVLYALYCGERLYEVKRAVRSESGFKAEIKIPLYSGSITAARFMWSDKLTPVRSKEVYKIQ